MKRRGWLAVIGVAAPLLGIGLAAAAVLTTERGLHWVLQGAQHALPGELRWAEATGRLIGPFTLHAVEYSDGSGEYHVARLTFDWAPGQLLAQRLSIDSLVVDAADIRLAENKTDTVTSPIEPGWSLPLELELRELRVTKLSIRRGAAAPLVIDSISTAASSDLEWMDVQSFTLRMAQGEFSAQGRVGLGSAVASDLAIDWRATLPGYAPLAAHGRLSGSWDELHIVQKFSAPTTADLQVVLQQPFDALDWDAQLSMPQIALTQIHPHWPPQQVGGTLQASGTRTEYRLDLSARAHGDEMPDATIAAVAQGDSAGLRIDTMQVQTLDGVLQGSGQLTWAPQLQWVMQVQATDIDPGKHWPDWPGKLSLQVHSSGHNSDQGLVLNARIEQLAGVLRGYPVRGSGAITQQNGVSSIEAVQLHSGSSQLMLDGELAEQWDLAWQLLAPDLRQLLPGFAGTLDARGTFKGPRAQPRLQTQAQLRDFAAADVRLAELQLDADLTLQPSAPLRFSARGKALQLAQRRFDDVAVELDGRLDRHALIAQAQGAVHALNLRALGGWDGARWTGRVERADWQLPEFGAWSLANPVALRLSAQKGALERLCWSQTPARLCAQIDYDARERRVRAELSDWSLPLHDVLPPAARLTGLSLAAQLNVRLPVDGIAQAEARAQLSSGILSWDEAGLRKQVGFAGGSAEMHLGAAGAAATAQLRLNGTDQLSAQARLPGYRLGADLAKQPLEGQLRGELRDFSLLNGLTEDIDQLSGVLRLDALLAGTPNAPQVHGSLKLTEGRMFIGPAGVQVEDWQTTLDDDAGNSLGNSPGVGALRLQGSARSGLGVVRIDGRLSRSPLRAAAAEGVDEDALHAELHVSGTDFEVVNLPEAHVLATPDLRCTLAGRGLTVDGTLLIPEARIEPRDLSAAVTPSRDVVQMDAPLETPPGWEVRSRVQVSLGERVTFKGYGLSGRLTGALAIVDEPGKQPRASGELAVRDGTYAAYGQKLKIEQGRVLYRESPLDNPGLDVRATRKIETDEVLGGVLAGVRVLGTAQAPHAELYSQPALPQADVLSYLMLGRPLEGASGGEGELLLKAARSLGLKGGTSLTQSIGRQFGLDEVSLGSVEGVDDDQEGTALKIGKYLSPRLYLNYSIGMLDAANQWQLRYRINKHLSVQTETGEATGGDVLYTIER